MMGWAGISLTAVGATGNITQLYPDCCTIGTGATTAGTQVRTPSEGTLSSLQVEPDAIDGGIIQVWDVNGADIGADVNTATAITQAQLTAALAAGTARLIFEQIFSGSSGARAAVSFGMPFTHGLAARYVNATGTCKLNITADGGFRKIHITGV